MYSVKSRELFFLSLCFVVLALKNNNSVESVIFIPSFTHSSLVLNLIEFHKCYFEGE